MSYLACPSSSHLPTFHSSWKNSLRRDQNFARPHNSSLCPFLHPEFCQPSQGLLPSLSFSLCGCEGLKKCSDLTVNTSLTVTALQPAWEQSPVIFYRNSQRITCSVGQPWAGLVQFSSSFCLLAGLCKDRLGPFRLETLELCCQARPGGRAIRHGSC